LALIALATFAAPARATPYTPDNGFTIEPFHRTDGGSFYVEDMVLRDTANVSTSLLSVFNVQLVYANGVTSPVFHQTDTTLDGNSNVVPGNDWMRQNGQGGSTIDSFVSTGLGTGVTQSSGNVPNPDSGWPGYNTTGAFPGISHGTPGGGLTDVNGDGRTDGFDLATILFDLFTGTGPDINGDHVFNSADLAFFLQHGFDAYSYGPGWWSTGGARRTNDGVANSYTIARLDMDQQDVIGMYATIAYKGTDGQLHFAAIGPELDQTPPPPQGSGVPEPASLALGLGAAAMVALRSRGARRPS
jgi:hypothetical protein